MNYHLREYRPTDARVGREEQLGMAWLELRSPPTGSWSGQCSCNPDTTWPLIRRLPHEAAERGCRRRARPFVPSFISSRPWGCNTVTASRSRPVQVEHGPPAETSAASCQPCGPLIHPASDKKNSRKLAVAISPALSRTPVPIGRGSTI